MTYIVQNFELQERSYYKIPLYYSDWLLKSAVAGGEV
jgi:hypothetical protein